MFILRRGLIGLICLMPLSLMGQKKTVTLRVVPDSISERLRFVGTAPDVVVVGDNFEVVYEINSQKATNFSSTAIPDLIQIMGPSRSYRAKTWEIKGKAYQSHRTTFTYLLKANESGEFVLPKAAVVSGNDTLYSNVIPIMAIDAVTDTTVQRERDALGGLDVFIDTEVSKDSLRLGETLEIRYRVYADANVGIKNMTCQPPVFDGFEVKRDTVSTEWEKVLCRGYYHNTCIIQQYTLSPTCVGVMEIPPIILNIYGDNASDLEFGNFFGVSYSSKLKKEKQTLLFPGVKIKVIADR